MQILEKFILARLWAAGNKGIGPAALFKSLELPGTSKAKNEAALSNILAQGWASPRPWRLTPAGIQRTIELWGPPPDQQTWGAVKKHWLLPAALGLQPKHLKTAGQLAAALVKKAENIEGPPGRSLKEVVDAVVLTSLGLAPTQKLTLNYLRGAALAKHLGLPHGPTPKLQRQLIAKAAGVVRTENAALEAAALGRWLAETKEAPLSFPEAVLRATLPPTAGFGRKAFIDATWDRLRQHPDYADLTLEEFKRKLIQAASEGHLRLSRADLTAAMDPTHLDASAISVMGATFHFIDRKEVAHEL